MQRFVTIVSIVLANVVLAFAQDAYMSGAPTAIVQARLLATTRASEITALARTAEGNLVVAGVTTDANLLARAPGMWQTKASSSEAFVALLSPQLESIVAWTFIGGSQAERIHSVTVGRNGDVVVVGETNSPDLPTTIGAFNQVHGGLSDGFFVILSPNLDSVRSCSYIGGAGRDIAYGVVADPFGGYVVVGQTGSRSTFRTVNAYTTTYRGGESDAFIAKFDYNGNVVFSTYFGSDGADAFRAVTVATDGAIVATGYTSSENFETWPRKLTPWDPTSARPFDPVFNGGHSDAVVVAFSNDGSRLIFSSFLGGLESETGVAITTTSSGRIAVVGETSSPNFPIQANSDSYKGHRDIFVAFIRADGQQLISSRLYGGLQDDVPCFVSTVTNDQVVVVGWSASHDVLPTAEGSTRVLQGESDVVVLRVASTGLLYSGRFGWHGREIAHAAVMDDEGDLYFAGGTTSVDLTSAVTAPSTAAENAPFIARFVFGAVELSNPRGGDRWCKGTPVTLSWHARDMKPSDDYTVQIAELGSERWETVVPPQTALRATWNPTTNLPGSLFHMRLVARRGHEVRTLDPVVIRVPASVELNPASAADCQGASVTLTVTATGTDLHYQWRKNGRAIVGATNPQYIIPNLEHTDEGRYDVQVVSSCGSPVTTPSASVTVVPSTKFSVEPVDRSILLGATLRLYAQAEGANLRYQWYHEGQPLEAQVAPSLEISNVNEAHRGRYHVVVSGTCGTVTSRAATVAINGTTSVSLSSSAQNVVWQSPNPATTTVRLRSNGVIQHAFVMNVLGAITTQCTLGNQGDGTDVVADVSEMPSGAYVVVLVSADSIQRVPFVVQR